MLKIVKHCQEEGSAGQDLVQGVLLGLVVDNRLEITNCFPFPRHNEDEDFDEGKNIVIKLVATVDYCYGYNWFSFVCCK